VDASAVVEFLLGTALGRAMQETLTAPDVDLHVPSLCDVEVASALQSRTPSEGSGAQVLEEVLTCLPEMPGRILRSWAGASEVAVR
jgi:predicted nucleic acid-binding protein